MGCGKSAQYKVDRVAQTGPCTSQLESLKMQKANASTEDIRDKYDIKEVLGSGSFGQVRRARPNDNPSEVRAVKVICWALAPLFQWTHQPTPSLSVYCTNRTRRCQKLSTPVHYFWALLALSFTVPHQPAPS